LTFARDGDRYRAGYTVSADLRRGGSVAHHFDAKETVRVATFRETSRSEESVIFQEYFELAPGTYTLAVTVQDDVALRRGQFEGEVTVPAAGARGISSSVSVHEATPRASVDSLPQIIASPRSTAVFGRDSLLTAYVEAYELPSGQSVQAAVRGERGAVLWSDSISLLQTGSVASGLVQVPVSPLGIGAVELVLWRSDGRDTSRTPFFVSFGEELPVASFDDMLVYLRYFASPRRLEALRDTTPDKRAQVWAAFLRETDPEPTTPQHEGLQAYFGRIQYANQTYREEGQGWLTDRGMVYVTFGDPDEIRVNLRNTNQRGQAQVWIYHRFQLQLVFIDQTGFNRWRLTPSSELEFQNAVRREQSR
jgi:GWxTD domain-containing protein